LCAARLVVAPVEVPPLGVVEAAVRAVLAAREVAAPRG
jgi:hypothetical protein